MLCLLKTGLFLAQSCLNTHPFGARIKLDRAIPEKAEPFARRGRKAADLPRTEMAELPKE